MRTHPSVHHVERITLREHGSNLMLTTSRLQATCHPKRKDEVQAPQRSNVWMFMWNPCLDRTHLLSKSLICPNLQILKARPIILLLRETTSEMRLLNVRTHLNLLIHLRLVLPHLLFGFAMKHLLLVCHASRRRYTGTHGDNLDRKRNEGRPGNVQKTNRNRKKG